MGAFTHAVELISRLFQHTEPTDFMINLIFPELLIDGSAQSTLRFILDGNMLLLIISKLSCPLTRTKVNFSNNIQTC